MTRKTKEELPEELESLKKRLNELEFANLEQESVIEELRESEAKYRLLFDAAPVGIGIADLEGNIIDANRNMQETSGFSLDEYRSIGVGATYADPEERMILLKTLREKGYVRDWKSRLKRKDGSEYHALLNADIMELGGRKVLLGIIRDISERKQVETALNAALRNAGEEKNKSDAIIAALGDGIIIQDTDYKIIYQNQIQNEIYGDRTGDLCYRTYEGRDKICEDCPVERTFIDGKIHRSERKFVTDNGVSYFELTSSPLRDSNRKIIAGIKVVRDITESRRIEQILRESEEKYRRLVETLMEGIWALDKDSNTTFVNPRMAQMLGYTVDEMLGKPLFSFMNEQGRINATRFLERREQNVKEQHDFEFIRKDGTKIYTSLETSPITDENGNYSGAVAAIADITERKRAEEALREGERFLENIFASIQDGIGIIDGDMNIIRVNKTVQSWYPYAAPFVGKKCYGAYHNRKERCEQCPAWETLKTGKSAYKEVPKHGPEGKEVGWLEIYSYPLNDTTTGKMKGVIEYVRDITERKKTEEELNKSKQLLERTFLSLSDAVFIIDSESTKIIDCNKAASKIFGYEKEEMLGRITAFLHVNKEALAEFRKKLYAAEEEKGFLYLPEFRMKRKNGECFFTENTVTPLLDDIGKRLGWVSVVRDITELKRAEEALLKSEEKFRGIFEQSPIAIELYDREGNLIDANRSCLDLFGINDIKSVIGFKLFEDPNIEQDKKNRLSNGEGIEFESVFDFEVVKKARLYETTKSGKCYLDILIVPLITEERGRYGYLIHLRDITERKRAEEQLAKSRTMLLKAQEIGHVGSWEWDIATNDLMWSKEVYNIYGLDPSKVTPKYDLVLESMAPESKKDFTKAIDDALKLRKPFEMEYSLIHPDDSRGYVHTKGEVLFDSEGHPITMYGMVQDVTERKHVENSLRLSNLVVENSQTVLFRWKADVGWPVEFVSNNVMQFGYSADEFLSGELPYASIIHPDDLERVSKEVREHSESGDSRFQQEYRIKAKNGAVHWIDDRTVIERNLDGHITNYQGIIIDITERKHAEESIRKYNRKLEESNRIKELFADIMHHDLLNPINVAHGYVELFLDEETNPQKKSYLNTIKRNLLKGTELIDNAQKFSKLESMQNIEFEDMDLKIVVTEAIDNLSPLAVNAKIRLKNGLKEKMPVRANKILEDVFANLISNAIKYANQGKMVVVDSKERDNLWIIRVMDFGAGIKDGDKKLIFERFQRRNKMGVKGSGLGLAIARKIVELHNGRIWVEDNPEGGAVFIVEIPKILDQLH